MRALLQVASNVVSNPSLRGQWATPLSRPADLIEIIGLDLKQNINFIQISFVKKGGIFLLV